MASKSSTNGSEKQSSLEEQRAKVNEVRASLGPLSDKLALYCSDASIARYLTARNWNVKKSIKMLKETLKWRLEYKPEEIRWEEIANEADTGKIYRASFVDKYGRSVLVMRPGCQNTKSTKGQIRYLVYCMENAILNLPANQEQMVWLIDFHGFNMSNISVKVTKETANVLQGHYPERLGVAILYNPPKFFESFWMVVKPFLETKTYRKVKFVYSDNPGTRKNMEDLFNMDELERAFGGNNATSFNISEYAERMREDDKRMPLFWSQENTVASSEPLAKTIANLNSGISESDSDDSNEPLEGDLSSNKGASTMSALDSLVVADDKGNDAADEHAELEGVSSSSNSESKSLRELEGVLSSSKLASTMSALDSLVVTDDKGNDAADVHAELEGVSSSSNSESKSLRELEGVLSSSKLASTMSALDSLVVADDKGNDAADVHAELERVSSSSKSESKSLRELEGVSSSNKLTSIMSALDSLVITDDKGNDAADEHAELEGVSSSKSESKSSADNRSPGSNGNLSGPGDVQSVTSEKDHSVRP